MKKMPNMMVFLVGIALAFTGCGRDGGSSTPATTPSTTPATTIGGTAVNGLMAVSTVKIYSVDSTGGNGTLLATASTDSTGKWTASIPTTATSGVVRVEVSGGSYVKESDSTVTITNTGTITAMANLGDTTVSSKKTALTITPISTFVDKRSTALAAGSTALSTAITTATDAIKKHIGITSDPLTVSVNLSDPAAVSTNPDGTITGLVLGALTKEADTLGVTDPGKLVSALADDFSDGVFDGKTSTATSITISGTTKLGVGAGSTGLTAALTDYLDPVKTPNGTAIKGGLTAATAATLISKINTSIATSTATSSAVLGQANVSTSASAALYTSGTTQKLYIAGKDKAKGLVIVDMSKSIDTSATVPANTTTTNPRLLLIQDPASAGACSITNTTACYKVDGLVVMNSKSLLGIFSYSSPYIIFVDLTKDAVATANPSLNTGLTVLGSWSGGSAYIAGMIADNGRNGIWFTANDGYYYVDMSVSPYTVAKKFSKTSANSVAENFGANIADNKIFGAGDTTKPYGYLWAPNYTTEDIIDITGNIVYSSDTTTHSYFYNSTGVTNGASWSFSRPDHGAVDTMLNVAFMTPEDAASVVIIDLNKAVFTTTTAPTASAAGVGTFSLPTSSVNKFSFSTENPILSGVTVESSNHIAFMMAAFGNTKVTALQLDAANANPTTVKDYIAVDIGSYSLSNDPHSVAIGADTTGNTIAYLPSSGSKCYALNLTNLLNSTKYSRTSTADHTLTTAATTAAMTAKDIDTIYY